MVRKKHLRTVCLFCVMVFIISMINIAFCAPVTETEIKDVIEKAEENSSHVKNFHLKLDGQLSMVVQNKNVELLLHSEGDIQITPILAKNVMNMTVKLGSAPQEMKITQYLQQDGKQLNIYTNMNKQWVKQVMPNAQPLFDSKPNKADYKLKIKKAVALNSNDQYNVYEVTIDGKQMEEVFKKSMALSEMSSIPLFADLLKDVGDFTYTVTIDKKNTLISGIDADLSNMAAAVGNNVVDMLVKNEQQKQAAQEVFGNLKLLVSIQCSQFNNATNIVIPEEALNAPLQQPISLPTMKNAGVVDVNKIMKDSKAVKTYQDRLNEMGRELSGKLQEEKASLTDEEFQQRQQENYQEFLTAKKNLEKEIEEHMKDAAAEVAKEKKLKSVIYKRSEKDPIPLGSIDITQDVMEKMDL